MFGLLVHLTPTDKIYIFTAILMSCSIPVCFLKKNKKTNMYLMATMFVVVSGGTLLSYVGSYVLTRELFYMWTNSMVPDEVYSSLRSTCAKAAICSHVALFFVHAVFLVICVRVSRAILVALVSASLPVLLAMPAIDDRLVRSYDDFNGASAVIHQHELDKVLVWIRTENDLGLGEELQNLSVSMPYNKKIQTSSIDRLYEYIDARAVVGEGVSLYVDPYWVKEQIELIGDGGRNVYGTNLPFCISYTRPSLLNMMMMYNIYWIDDDVLLFNVGGYRVVIWDMKRGEGGVVAYGEILSVSVN